MITNVRAGEVVKGSALYSRFPGSTEENQGKVLSEWSV